MQAATGFGGVLLVLAISMFVPGAQQVSTQPLPNSELAVGLLGIAMDTAVPAKSACLVRCSYPGEQHTITVLLAAGQRACNVAEIAEIRQRSVVIRNLAANRLELLTFPTTDAASSQTTPAPPSVESPERVESTHLVTVEIPKNSMDHYLANLPELLNSASPVPHFRDAGNGQSIIDGFEIKGIRAGGAAEQLGLQNGDVIVEVNGDMLNGAAAVLRLLGQAPTMSQTTMIVLRNGQRMTFAVSVK
jgi:membrane-associated protease RseP (regulator of RpoE activity)